MRLPLFRAVWVLALCSALLAQAKIEEWKDLKGNAFTAEPAEALGPFALFRTAAGGGRRLPWRALSHDDCARFARELENRPPLAAHWADATGELTARLRGYLGRFEGVSLVTADFKSVPEPEMLIVLYVDNSASGSWEMIEHSIPLYNAVRTKFPGKVEAIQFGTNHGMQEHNDMGLRSRAPWLLADYNEQPRMTPIYRLNPARQRFAIYAFSRDGVPIFGTNDPDKAALDQFFGDVGALLGLLQPGNPLTWADRAHYLAAIQAANHQRDHAGPILVGNPLVAQGLRERGIFRVEATIEVGADGKPTAVTLKDGVPVPPAMGPALIKALQRSAVFVPAVDKGQFVAGTYDYLIEVPR